MYVLVYSFAAGLLPNWILVGMALFAAWRLSRGGAGSAVGELSEANRVLTRRTQELAGEVRDLKIENAELRTHTNFKAVIDEHERRALDRHERVLNVLDLIAERLGPEPGSGGP